MDWKKLLFAAFVYAVLSLIIHTFGAFLSMQYYLDPQLAPLWSNLMMPSDAAPPLKFYAASFAASIIVGIIFSYTYVLIKNAIKPGKSVESGILFGLFLFLINGIPALLSMSLLFSLPLGLLLAWQVEGLAIYLCFGLAIVRIMK
jgi:hypothetical protein